jgi:hypothetical protein
MIFDNNSINNCNFKIKKPFFYNNKITFDLYSENDENIFFESLSMIIPFKYILDENSQKLSLTLYEYKSNKYGKKINLILEKIIKCTKKHYEKLFKEKIFKSPIILNNSTTIFQFNNIRYNEIEIYNKFREKINIKNIETDDRISIIFHLKNIWIQNNKYGFNLDLIQIRRDNYIDREYLFLDQKKNLIINNNIIEKDKNLSIDLINNSSIKRPALNLQEILNMRNSILKKTINS